MARLDWSVEILRRLRQPLGQAVVGVSCRRAHRLPVAAQRVRQVMHRLGEQGGAVVGREWAEPREGSLDRRPNVARSHAQGLRHGWHRGRRRRRALLRGRLADLRAVPLDRHDDAPHAVDLHRERRAARQHRQGGCEARCRSTSESCEGHAFVSNEPMPACSACSGWTDAPSTSDRW